MLSAGGDDDLLRRGVQAMALDPGGAGGAMVGASAVGMVIEQIA
jgi:hypothetical protein